MSSDKTNPEPALRPEGEEETTAVFTPYKVEQLDDQSPQQFVRALLAFLRHSQTEEAGTAANPRALLRKWRYQNWMHQWSDREFAAVPHHTFSRPRPAADESAEKERQEKEIERLRKEGERLTVQNELLQTRVAEQRRSLARETRNSDKLHAELVGVREQNGQLLSTQDRFLTLLHDRGRTNDALVTQMAGVEDGLIRMHECYEGEVQHVGENTAVVLYNVDGQLVEQVYERKQFKDGKLPPPGTCVRVLVFIVEYEPKPPSAEELECVTNDRPSRRQPLTGPVEF